MFTHTITIGRNVGTDPMNDVAWSTFQTDMLDALHEASHTSYGAEQFSTRLGDGEWEGVAEESATITALSPERMPLYRLLALQGKLALKCREYKQDAIALSVNAVSELITFDRHSGI